MKLLVIVSLAAVALAKPTEKPLQKRQFNFNALAPNFNQDVNQFGGRTFLNGFHIETQSEKTPRISANQISNQFSIGGNGLFPQQRYSVINGPEITDIGSSGLNSNGLVSTTTYSPLLSSSSFFPTSTTSNLLNSEISSINSIPSSKTLSANSIAFSGVIPQNFGPTVTPLPKVSTTFPHSLIGLNSNPTAFPVVSSTVLPISSLQSRFEGSVLSNNSPGLDLPSYNFDNFGNFEQFEIKNNDKAEVTKNVYFYEAPEEPEMIRQRKIIQLPPQKKNYKLLFIKAPVAPESQPIEIPAQILNQEKTRVYVLVKKPETEQVVKIVEGSTPKPEKPEVFYIKYKTREEAEKAIKEAQEGASQGQESISVNGQQLVNSIRNIKFTENHRDSALQPIFSHNIPVSLFESSTSQPILSSTFSPDVNYVSGASGGLLNDGSFNQFVTSYTPSLLGNNVFPKTVGSPFSPRNNIFSNTNLGLDTSNLGSFESSTFSPITYVSSGFSNFPSFVDLSQRSGSGSRSGRVNEFQDNKVPSTSTSSTSSSIFGESFESQTANKFEEKSISSKDEPLALSLGSGASTSSPVLKNSVEVTPTTESSDVNSSTSSE
ncbi:uncharacterized protein LOC123307848 [Coccinella septempunctata]|uniref:uncharacterized protein LOC123307848 n=1 Tax=Coccinella septempunctata TaxID=41139 RepID=UPI001D09636E|nr:uncharacterized protein LOC123307848 [Coccinella septempunctata]